jgi:phosphatidylinositol alpha-mannosyltransferase
MPNPSKATDTKLKIGFVLDDSLDTPDGVQQYVMTVSTWLKDQGHDVHYLVGETQRTDIPQLHSLSRNVKVRFNRNRMSMPLPASRTKLRALLEKEQFDVLHVQLPYSPFLAGRIITAAPTATAIVGTFHVAPHSMIVHAANTLLRLMTRRSLRHFNAVMSVSSVAQAFAKKTFKLDSTVVPNTIDLSPYHQAQEFPQYADVQTITFLGRLVDRKGCQYLLSAVANMQAAGGVRAPYKVIICGKGPLEAELKHYAAGHGLQDIVEFVGFIDEADKPRYMASSDIAIFPSTGGESFGIVLLEAMAASRGVVLAGDNPGYASVMANRPEALFNPQKTAALADLLRGYLNDPLARKSARRWQRQEVQRYDIATVGTRIVEQYRLALHKRRA